MHRKLMTVTVPEGSSFSTLLSEAVMILKKRKKRKERGNRTERDFIVCRCFCLILGAQGQGGERGDARICGTAVLLTLCPAYIKHALLLRSEQKGKQCHQVKFLRIPQTRRQIDPSPHQNQERKKVFCSTSINVVYPSQNERETLFRREGKVC